MKRKIGPLPLWVWIGTAAAVAAVIYMRARSSGGLATPAAVPAAPDDQLTGTGAVSGGQGLTSTLPTDGAFSDPAPPPTVGVDPLGPLIVPSFDYGLPDITEPRPFDTPAAAPPAPTSTIKKAVAKVKPKRRRKTRVASGHANRGKHRAPHSKAPAHHTPAHAPGQKPGHRAPAHPHEHVHAPTNSHRAPAPAHTRFNAPASGRPGSTHPNAPHAPGAVPKPHGTPVKGSPGKVRLPANPPRPVAHIAPRPPARTVTPAKRKR